MYQENISAIFFKELYLLPASGRKGRKKISFGQNKLLICKLKQAKNMSCFLGSVNLFHYTPVIENSTSHSSRNIFPLYYSTIYSY